MYQNINKIYHAAIYVRLSKEDGDISSSAKLESNSISNQKALILDFLKDKKDIEVVSVRVDDGYSGSNFERPGFVQMMEDIKHGKINCVIVKDLFRLGRNYVETSNYIERVFPFFHVRFLAVTDDFDSFREGVDLTVPLKNIINELNAHGIAMAGIKVDINPIAEKRITLAEYMKEADAYLDQQEIKKLAVDLDNFSYEYDTYEYKDTVENREEQVEKITEDILNKKTECLKDWLVEVSEESDIDSDVITARSLLSRLEDAERFSIFDKQPEQEQPEATISFYVAECMEFPVMGEYHNNLTLEEAIKIYESIPAERLHGIKGIGFDLQDGDEDYSGEYGLMSGDRIDRDLIDMIPHYKESPLVQKAINDMEKYLNEKHGKVQEAEQTVEVKQKVSETPFKKESVSVEPNREQNKEPAKGGKGKLKKSVLQSLKEFQARAKAQEQKEMATEKSKAHKKGNVEL